MPILHIRALPQPEPSKIEPALKKTCLVIAEAYGCHPEQVWATWEEIKPGFYTEGETSKEIQPRNTHPPLGQLLCFEGKDSDTIETILSKAATTLSSALGIKNNIFLTYQEIKSGQVIAGNGVLRKNK